MADDYKIKIVTEGDPRGAERVADSIQKVSRSANDNAKATKEASRGLNELGESSEKGAALGRVLGEVMRGNIGALAQLGAALKATAAGLKSNVFGILLIAATALFNFLPPLIARLRGAKDEIGEAAVKADLLAAAFDKIAKGRGSSLAQQLDAMRDEAKGAADELQRVLSLQEMLLKAQGKDTPEEQRKREDTKLGADYLAAVQRRDQTSALADGLNAEMATLTQNAVLRPNQATEERAAMERELASLGSVSLDPSPSGIARNERISQLTSRLQRGQVSPETEKFLSEQKRLIEQLRPIVEKAEAAAKEALATVNQLGRGVVGIRPDGSAIREPAVMAARAAEDRRAREAAGIPEPVSSIAPGARMDTPGTISYARPDMSEAIARAIVPAGERNGAEIAQMMAAAVEKMYAAEREKFREQLKALQR